MEYDVALIENEDLKEALLAKYQHIIGVQYSNATSVDKIIEDIISYYESIIGCMPGNVYWFDKNCIAVGCNNNVLKMFGFNSIKQYKGLTFEDMGRIGNWTKEAEESFKNDSLAVITTGASRLNIEEPPIPHSDGHLLYFLTSRVPLFDKKQRVVGYVGVSIDVTNIRMAEASERKALGQAAEADAKAKAEAELRQAVMILTGSIVHDLRTPITTIGIIGSNLETFLPALLNAYEKAWEANLLSETIPNKQLNYLKSIGSSLQSLSADMHEFINVTLKTLSKTLIGGLNAEDLVECSIAHCINQTITRYPFTEGENKLIEWQQHYDFKFMGNVLLMIRVLTNLIKNSLFQIEKHKKGKIIITTGEAADYNILRVRDTAGGVSEETVGKIFEAYKSTKADGTGVGLAFCKRTMQDFNGDIVCESNFGEYIEFILTFPKLTTKH